MTRNRFLLILAAAVALFTAKAHAHRIDEYLQATLLTLQPTRVEASMRLIPGVVVAPGIIAAIDRNGDGTFSPAEQRDYALRVLADLTLTVDGRPIQPTLVRCSFPQPAELRSGLGEIHIDYTAPIPTGSGSRSLILENHHQRTNSVYLINTLVPQDDQLRILAQKRTPTQTTYELDFEQTASTITPFAKLRTSLAGVQLSTLFHLGLHHIAEGTDHLLFLLTLLLPAPLLARHRRWGQPATVRHSLGHIAGIVTAFTIGHSITLTLAALGKLHLPSRPIEVLIAVSILVSAIHALRPIVPGKEAVIAIFFGLIHGLAFAATLDRLGLGLWQRVAGVLSFNLGIEAIQMLVVAAILPSLLILSRTAAYSWLRIVGATFAALASLGWIIERLFDLQTPVDAIVNTLAAHALAFAVALFVISCLCRLALPAPGPQNPAARPRVAPLVE